MRRHGAGQRGSSSGGGAGGPTFMCGGKKLGGIPWEKAIPDPGQTTQLRVPRQKDKAP